MDLTTSSVGHPNDIQHATQILPRIKASNVHTTYMLNRFLIGHKRVNYHLRESELVGQKNNHLRPIYLNSLLPKLRGATHEHLKRDILSYTTHKMT